MQTFHFAAAQLRLLANAFKHILVRGWCVWAIFLQSVQLVERRSFSVPIKKTTFAACGAVENVCCVHAHAQSPNLVTGLFVSSTTSLHICQPLLLTLHQNNRGFARERGLTLTWLYRGGSQAWHLAEFVSINRKGPVTDPSATWIIRDRG